MFRRTLENATKSFSIVEEKMEQACVMSGRDKSEVKLLPVTKNWPSEIVSYCKNAGFDRVGENRVQEALSKSADISGMRWDLIGHLQTNKVKDVIGKFSRIQTVDSLKLIQKLQEIACNYAIGRDIHVGDTIIGIKGRVGFEAAAPLILIKAHHLLEKHTLTKWQQYQKEQMAHFYGMQLHEGHYLDPVMRDIESFFESSQKNVIFNKSNRSNGSFS